MNGEHNTSGFVLWMGVWVAVYMPQLILVIQHWKTIVATIPMWTAGLLGVLEVVACIATLAALSAAFAIGVGQMRLRRQGA
jgi:hypothetical protein